jgi:hypothetical protein
VEDLSEQALIAEAGGQNPRGVALLPAAWLLARRAMRRAEPGRRPVPLPLLGGWGRMGVGQVVIPGLEDMLRRGVTLRGAMEQLALRTMDQHVRIAWRALRRTHERMWPAHGGRSSVERATEKRFSAWADGVPAGAGDGLAAPMGLVDGGACTERGRQCLERIRGLVRRKGAMNEPAGFLPGKGYETALLLTYSFDPLFFERVVLRDLGSAEPASAWWSRTRTNWRRPCPGRPDR